MTEILWLERAAELAEAANQALRASHECLREAEQARLAAERMSSAAGVRTGPGLSEAAPTVGALSPRTPAAEDYPAFGSPFAGSRDPGTLPGALGSRSLRSVG